MHEPTMECSNPSNLSVLHSQALTCSTQLMMTSPEESPKVKPWRHSYSIIWMIPKVHHFILIICHVILICFNVRMTCIIDTIRVDHVILVFSSWPSSVYWWSNLLRHKPPLPSGFLCHWTIWPVDSSFEIAQNLPFGMAKLISFPAHLAEQFPFHDDAKKMIQKRAQEIAWTNIKKWSANEQLERGHVDAC